jgi:hypothetical protein
MSAYVDATIFHDYLQDVLIPKIEEFSEAMVILDMPAMLSKDNCLAHTSLAIIQLFSQHRVKVITFPPHIFGIVQMLDLVFFGAFKRAKKHLAKGPSRPVTENHASQMVKACGSARAGSRVRTSFIRIGSIYVRGAAGGDTFASDEAKVREADEFRAV